LRSAIDALKLANIEYMVVGSIASSIYGPPRLTYDVDIIISVLPEDVDALLRSFPAPRYYFDRDAILDAIARKAEFNIIDSEEGGKIDFWVLEGDRYSRERFSRRRLATFQNTEFYVTSPEDTILMKLKWAVMSGGSEKQFVDALGVLEVNFGNLDLTYMNAWAKALKIEDLWQRLQDQAKPI